MIPKVIHYIWLGDESFQSDTIKMCIDSWHKKLPDYDIICHNESNIDMKHDSLVKELYCKGFYAYASDVLRLQILIQNPGIYLDTDIEVVKPFSEDILRNKAFIGCEHSKRIACGVIGVDHINDPLLLKWYYWYTGKLLSDLKYNPEIITKIFRDIGFTSVRKYPKLIDDWMIYPQEYFYPINYFEDHHKITSNSTTIHYWVGSAIDDKEKWKSRIDSIFENNKELVDKLRGGLI